MMGGSFNGGHVMELRVRSDAEKKVWEEKIMQQDKLSSVMGEYLLKGYRMLDSYCDDCGVSEVMFPLELFSNKL